ncbi:MAG TPA: hypothetical protein VII44_03965 [Puia sp.]
MKRLFIPVLTVFLVCACHSKQPETKPGNANQTDTSKKNYLPVAELLRTEIADVDSFPLRLMRYRIVNGKTDSGIITTPVFDQIAKEFLMADLDSSHFEKNFEENSFVDRSTNLISFTYSTKDTGYGLKRVDVLLSPGSGSDKLNSIYMEAISGNKDSSVISKMSWKAGRNFRILQIQQPKNGQETTNQTIVVWDSRE